MSDFGVKCEQMAVALRKLKLAEAQVVVEVISTVAALGAAQRVAEASLGREVTTNPEITEKFAVILDLVFNAKSNAEAKAIGRGFGDIAAQGIIAAFATQQ